MSFFLWDYDFSKNKTISINHVFFPRKEARSKLIKSSVAIKLKARKIKTDCKPLPVTVDSFILKIDFKDLEVQEPLLIKIKKIFLKS